MAGINALGVVEAQMVAATTYRSILVLLLGPECGNSEWKVNQNLQNTSTDSIVETKEFLNDGAH